MHYQDERTYGCRISDSWTYRGLKVVVMENELLRVSIIADKGADIFELVHKPTDTDFMWRTPWSVRETSKWIPPTGNGDNIWHDAYIGGWQTIAPTAGAPQKYAGADIGQHTEATLMPWDVSILEDTPNKVSAKFWVRTIRTPFWIEKTITLKSKSPIVTVVDSLTNEAETTSIAQWGQHVALGEPFLTEGSILDIPNSSFLVPHIESQVGNTRLKSGSTGEWPTAESPDGKPVDLRTMPKRTEQLEDYMAFKDLDDGWYAVTDPKKGIGFGLIWPKETFKYLWYWQVFGGGPGYPWYNRTYNVGLEPFSGLSGGEPEPGSDKSTNLSFEPGETKTATIKAVIFESEKGVTHIENDGTVITRE